jgi:antitoxin (DNA-binding transcriptional repressor) of toxin-antitoxin stability system
MPTLNMRGLRDTRRLKSWLKAGKTIELKDRDRVIGRIVPERPQEPPAEMPDFAARMKKIFGDRVLPVVETVIEERGRY